MESIMSIKKGKEIKFKLDALRLGWDVNKGADRSCSSYIFCVIPSLSINGKDVIISVHQTMRQFPWA